MVTPSFNMLDYLKRCRASIADQGLDGVQHVIMDGGSSDGTAMWLSSQEPVEWVSERDEGMYDAVNKGWARCDGEILSYLNCDEQYLPGTLKFARDYFERNPSVDMIFGDALLVNPDGSLVSYRKGYQPRWFHILSSHLYVLSCTMFFRRRIFDEGFKFDTTFRNTGDSDFVVRVLRQGFKVKHVPRFFSVFTWTGQNLSADESARAEHLRMFQSAPLWVRALRLPLNALRLVEKVMSGAYRQHLPLEYRIYGPDDLTRREKFVAQKASWHWPS
ncbi:MAG: glycosyltransferase [Verrucomicrobia bacterium]|nr:glycosyltransferase [Verrucomicrobiota bacterium]